MNSVVIRNADERDLPAVRCILVRAMTDAYALELDAAAIAQRNLLWHSISALTPQLRNARASFLVAEQWDGEVVGHLLADARRPDVLQLRRLFVKPSHQRRGIGSAMLADLIARRPAARRVLLDVDSSNMRARAFYKREGFLASCEISEGWRDLIQMVRVIS